MSFLSNELSDSVPWYVEPAHYAPDSMMASFGASEEIWEFTGEPGDALIADTRRLLHSGSRCSEDRLLFVADYTSGFAYSSRTPHHDPWKLGTESDQLSLFQRLDLGHAISAKGLNFGFWAPSRQPPNLGVEEA